MNMTKPARYLHVEKICKNQFSSLTEIIGKRFTTEFRSGAVEMAIDYFAACKIGNRAKMLECKRPFAGKIRISQFSTGKYIFIPLYLEWLNFMKINPTC